MDEVGGFSDHTAVDPPPLPLRRRFGDDAAAHFVPEIAHVATLRGCSLIG